MATGGRTTINVRGMKRMEREIRQGLRSTAPSPIRDAFKQWGFRYRSFSRERYDRFSKGGGNWKGLTEGTKKQRRGEGERASILRDKNTLFMVFNPTFKHLAGQYEKGVPFGVVVGYGGPARHPEAKMTVAKLAEIHHGGLGNNPERKLVVEPKDFLKRQMAGDMERAITKIIKASQVRPA